MSQSFQSLNKQLASSLVVVFLLCQCASKHQPQVFPAYFPLDPDYLLADAVLAEFRALEQKPNRNSKENKRLFDLYSAEVRTLRPGSERFVKVTESLEKLKGQVGEETEILLALQMESLKKDEERTREPSRKSLESAVLKKTIADAYRLWNSNQNEAALQKVTTFSSDSTQMAALKPHEKHRLGLLHFRIALDMAQLAVAAKILPLLQETEPCSTETIQAGFSLAVAQLGAGQATEGQRVFLSVCTTPDQGETAMQRNSGELRRKYWAARFAEAVGGKNDFATVFEREPPGYYSYLASLRSGVMLTPPQPVPEWAEVTGRELKTSSAVARDMAQAEERLRYSLRRDASLFLRRASDRLLKDQDEDDRLTLLYLAHLYHAAGNHLEALRIYSYLQRHALSGDATSYLLRGKEVFERMFPRPFGDTVGWLAKQWQIDPDLVYSLMRQESAFNPGAVSSANARGLLQIMPALGKSIAGQFHYEGSFSEKSLFRGEENIRLSVFHLRQLWVRAPHLVLVAASYNAGLSRVANWWRRNGHLPLDIFVELIPVGETRDYVKYVLRNYVCYKLLMTGKPVKDLFPLQLPVPPPLPVTF